MSGEHSTREVRPFNGPEYALLVLNYWKRMIHRTDYWKNFTPPRNILMRDTPDPTEVREAIDLAIVAIREMVERDAEREREGRTRG